MSYYTTPNEAAYAKCQAHGCDIDLARGEEIFTCRHEDCLASKICIGCVFACADCSEDFCEKHTVDLMKGEGPGALIVCLACLKQRHEPKEKAA